MKKKIIISNLLRQLISIFSRIKKHPFQQIFSLMSFDNFFNKNFYNYISENKNKAWKIIINCINHNSKDTFQLKTSVFRLNDLKKEVELLKDYLLPIDEEISDNFPPKRKLRKLDAESINPINN